MATHSGNEGFVQDGNTTIGEIRTFNVNETIATIDDSALNDASDTHLIGSKAWTGAVTVAMDVTDAIQANMTIGSEHAYTFLLAGNVSGQPSLTGNATITGIGQSVERNTLTLSEYTLTGQGALTRGTV